MVATSNKMQFDQIYNELEKTFQLGELFASAIGVQITTVLWIPVAIQLPTSTISCLVTVIDEDESRFLLVAKFEIKTNVFMFANIELRGSEKIIAWALIPRPYNSDSEF